MYLLSKYNEYPKTICPKILGTCLYMDVKTTSTSNVSSWTCLEKWSYLYIEVQPEAKPCLNMLVFSLYNKD